MAEPIEQEEQPKPKPKTPPVSKPAPQAVPPGGQPAPGPGNPQPAPAPMTPSRIGPTGLQQPKPQRSSFAQDFAADRAQGATPNARAADREFSYWEDPKRVARYRNLIRSQPPGYELPPGFDREQIEQAYQYLKFRNNDKPWTDWKGLAADDPGTGFLKSMPTPPPEFQMPGDRDYSSFTEPQPIPDTDPFGDWDNLKLWQQLYLGIMSPQPGMKDRPEWTRFTAAAGQGLLAVPGAAALGAIGGPVGALGLGSAALLTTAYQAYTGTRIPVVADILDVFNLLSVGAMRTIGLVGQIENEGLDTVLKELPAAWQAAQLNYVVQEADLLNTIAVLAGDEAAGSREVWQIAQGYAEPQALAAGQMGVVRGADALKEARRRILSGEDPLIVYQDFNNRFGDSGTFNDFIMQTLIDPTNLVPGAIGKAGEGVARAFGNERLATAFGEGVGNPIIDMIPFGDLLGRPFGLHGSEGPLQSFQKYQGWVKTGYFPGADPKVTPASQLSSFEKWAGGLDEQGRIREVQTRKPTGNKVKDFVTYLNSLTPEAQASAFMSMFHDNVNVILSLAETDPEQMVKFLRQAAAIDPLEVGQVGQAVLSSPVTATIAQTLRDVLADNWDQDMLLRWTEAQPKRDMLEKIARALNERPADVLDMYRDTPDVLLSRVAQVSGIEGTRDSLKALFDVFTGEDALPWNVNEFRARLAVTVFDKMDASLAARYGIKPDAAVFRLSQTLKGTQSLLLLGLNPSYFINNQLNNMVTRAATGVFGYMSPRQIQATLDRMGIVPDRMADAINPDGTGQAGAGILKAKQGSDWIAKTQGVVSAVNGKLGIFSKFSSAGERLESSNAYVIGMLRFWNKAWRRDKGLRRMHPTVEAMLDRQYPGIKEAIYQVAEAGMNMEEIEAKLFGDAIRPEVQAVIDDAARQLFPDHPEDGASLLKETGVQAKLEQLLANAETPAQIRYAFERVKKDIQNVVDEAAKIEEANRSEDIKNKMTTEGNGAIREALEQVARRIDRQRAEVGWTRASNYAAQTYAGILKGLGKSVTDTRIKEQIVEIRKAGQDFAKERTRIVTALKKAKGARETELRLQLSELHDRYKSQQAEAMARLEKLLPRREAETAAPRPVSDRMKALNDIAEKYGLTDATGKPVARYLMNVVNARRKKGEKYTDPEQIPLDEADAAAAAHKAKHFSESAERARRLKLTVDDIVRIADEDARAAEIQAAGMLTRRLVREQLAEAFDANDAETEAALALMDAHADRVARMQGRTPSAATRDAWYATRIARITGSEDPGAAINNYYQEAYGGLVALHNLKVDNLIEADRLGGMPSPSIAVLKSHKRFTDYGEITLIGRRELVDPQADPSNRVFSGDVYSPARPTPVYDPVTPETARPVVEMFSQADRETGDYFGSKLWDALVTNPDEIQALTLFTKHGTPRIVFLRERGITVDIPQAEPFTALPFTRQPDLVAWLDANADRLRDARRSQGEAFTRDPLYAEFTQVVRQAVEASGRNAITGDEPDAYWRKLTAPTGEVTSGYFDKVLQDYTEIKKGSRPDMVAARARAMQLLLDHGLKDEYNKWAADIVRGMYQEPKLIIDGERVPYNLENVTRYMTRQGVRGAVEDGSLEGRATAQGAEEFSSVDEMRRASDRLVSKEEASSYDYELNLKLTPFINQVESFYFNVDKWNPEGDALKALGEYLQGGKDRDPERMREALEKYQFEVDVDEVIDLALDAAEAAADAPAAYFEAKPQRAVSFNEFAGAVVPENAPPEVFEILERRGIEYRTYAPDSDVSRERAISKFYERDNVLFQRAAPYRESIRKIREAGFVNPAAVRGVFEGGTPAYTRGVVRYILEKYEKYKRGEMTVRDVAKAYLITVSSQGADALTWRKVRERAEAVGIRFVRDGQPMDVSHFITRQGARAMIRPEEYAALWLMTDQGRAALDALERGEITDGWRQFVESREVYGRFGRGVKHKKAGGQTVLDEFGNKIPLEKPGDWFIKKGGANKRNLADIQAIADEINAAKGDTQKISQIIAGMAGVSEGKTAFVKHMLGFGDETVVDTQQANFWFEFLAEDPRIPLQAAKDFQANWAKKGVINDVKQMIESAYWQLRSEGIGADIPPEVFTYVMHHWLWSVQKGAVGDIGTTHTGMYEALELAQEAKGGVHFLNDGRAVIRAMQAGDVSTMVHEIGHVFRRDLDDGDLDAVAKLGGLSGAAELRELTGRFVRGEIVPGDPEYQRYVDAEEYFARGWERYLAEGDAPTPALRSVFQKFTDWMLKIYRRLRATVNVGRRRVSGFEQQEDFQVGGRTVDIRASVNGRSLRDIFDEMISDGRIDGDAQAAAEAAARPDPLTQETPQETDLLRGPVKNLPPHVQKAMAQVAGQLLSELAPSRQIVLPDNTRTWEGPQWYKDAIESEKRAGKKPDDLKDQYMGQLRSIISGKDTGKSGAGPFIKSLILERARGQADIDSNIQPAILRYLGETDQLFEAFGDAILSSEEPQLRDMFGDEWEQVLDEALEWAAGRDEGGPLPDEQFDITGQPVGEPTPELAQAAPRRPRRQRPEAVPPVDLFGQPTGEAFNLEAQQAQAETFRPQEQAQQGSLFDRGEFLKGIEGRQASDSAAPLGDEDQPSLFQMAPPVESTAFRKWFGESKAIDESGEPMQLYHGTLSDFQTFSRRGGNVEGYWGDGLYFTNEVDDANLYASPGEPDWKAKIEAARETYEYVDDWNDFDPERLARVMGEDVDTVQDWIDEGDLEDHLTDEHITRLAYEDLGIVNEGNVMLVYVKTEKPLDLTNDRDYLDYEEGYDPDTDEYTGEESGRLVDAIQAVRDAATEYANIDTDEVITSILNEAAGNGGMSARKFFELLRKSEAVQMAELDTGNDVKYASGQFLQDVARYMGYDGIIMDAWAAFGPGPRRAAMPGVYQNTRHVIVFRPEQVKSVFNQGTFDPDNPNILYQGTQRPDPVAPEGGTPTPEPYGSILDEVTADRVMPMLDAAEARYIEQLGQRQFKMGDLDPEAQGEIRKYMNQVRGDLASTKYAAMTYGQQMRDQSLLNYNRRYGVDNYLDIVFPYHFWYTNSMVEWGKRMIDRPAWFATYARMQDAQEKMAANMPTRLKGKVRIPAPWLPDWAGGGLWVDPTAKLFPFAPFGQPFEQFAKNTDQVQRRAEQVLDDMVSADKITPQEAAAARESRSGSAWAQAMTQAQLDLDKQGSPLNMVNMMMSPALWWTAGANLLHGKPLTSSPLPITKTASAVETATRGTFLEPVGKLAGLAAWPEKAARRAGGLSEFGDWGNWYVDRQLANMAAEGLISAEQAKIAMIERTGPVFDDAYQRVQYEQMLQVPGAALLNQAASGNIGGALQAIPTLIFSGSLFPEGELKLNGLKDDFAKAMQDRQRGDDQAVNKFFEEHPEYEARLALNDEPEERLRQFLISEVWDRYSSLESANRKAAADQMGDQFRNAFLNKETRSYDSIPVETLARWTQMLGGPVPDVEATAGAIESPEPPVELYDPETAAAIGDYQDERRAKFPNYYAQQSAYYAVPEADRAGRKRILARFPELREYWDWKRQYKNDHPELADYFEGNVPGKAQAAPTVTPQELAQVDGILMRQLLAWQMFGQPLTSGAHAELARLAKGRASSEDYARQVLASIMPGQ